MRIFTLLLIFFCFVTIKGRTTNPPSKNRQTTTPTKKDENLNSNVQNDPMENEMNADDQYNEEEMMNDDDEITKSEENLGKHYFQGDVLTTDDQMAKINRMLDAGSDNNADQLHVRALIKDVRKKWKKGVVPYVIGANVDNIRKAIIKSAIKHWEEKTCLKFKKRDEEDDYVEFKQGPGCSSYVGRIGGKQNLIVGNRLHGCRVGNIIHELGHTVGFFHEQSRPDRDQFVKIAWRNVKKAYRVNFMKFSKRIIDSKDVKYDYDSIMHYPRKIFGKKSHKPTVLPKKDRNAKIGQRRGLSKLDILQIGKLYACPAKTETDIDNSMNNNSESKEDTDIDMDPMSESAS